MTKQEAQGLVDQGDLTWGHLKQWLQLAEADGRTDGVSRVNPSLTKRQSIGILIASTDTKEDNELLISPRFTPRRNAHGRLVAVNVIREVGCGQ